MSSYEGIMLPPITDRTTQHIAELMIETREFFRIQDENPQAALSFWGRIVNEFTKEYGYCPQELDGLSWQADILLAGQGITETNYDR